MNFIHLVDAPAPDMPPRHVPVTFPEASEGNDPIIIPSHGLSVPNLYRTEIYRKKKRVEKYLFISETFNNVAASPCGGPKEKSGIKGDV